MMCVNATPLAVPTMSSSLHYFILLAAILIIASLIFHFQNNRSPIKVLGLTYDKETHKLELTLQNMSSEPYNVKSAMRLVQPAQQILDQVTSEGGIPMASAKASIGDRSLFQLLAEDDAPVDLAPNETKTVTYEIGVPQGFLTLESANDVEVHISYSGTDMLTKSVEDEIGDLSYEDIPTESLDEKPSTNYVSQTSESGLVNGGISMSVTSGDDSFDLSLGGGDDEVMLKGGNPLYLLEDLLDALKASTDEAVSYHMDEGNEIAQWVSDVVGNAELSAKIQSVDSKEQIIDLVFAQIEQMKHPYLRNVGGDQKFILKTNADTVLAEISHLEDLGEVMSSMPKDSLEFHLQNGNDFASWIQAAVGDAKLADQIRGIDYSNIDSARSQVVSTIRERVDSLKD